MNQQMALREKWKASKDNCTYGQLRSDLFHCLNLLRTHWGSQMDNYAIFAFPLLINFNGALSISEDIHLSGHFCVSVSLI